MDMGVAALADAGNGLADVVSVLDHGVALGDVGKRQLVAKGDGVERLEGNGLVGLHHPAGKLLAGIRVLDHHHAHAVVLVVDEKIRRPHVLPPIELVAPSSFKN